MRLREQAYDCVCVCVVEHEDRLDDPLSPGGCVEPASRGQAAITTSWALSRRRPTLYSTRAASLTDGRRAWRTSRQAGRKTKDLPRVNILTLHWIFEIAVSLQTAENWEKAVGVIGPQLLRSEVNSLIWVLTPFKTNLRLCVIVPLTKFLTWSL